MFPPNFTKHDLIKLLRSMSADDFARYRYCEEMAGAHLSIATFEHSLFAAMQMCDDIKVAKRLEDDIDKWIKFKNKIEFLQGSTLGSLITILERHGIRKEDISYLRWIKRQRDFFVHRLFHEGHWPGDLDSFGCKVMTRRLLALQIRLSRAERNVWKIFERAGFVTMADLGDDGALVVNRKLFDGLSED